MNESNEKPSTKQNEGIELKVNELVGYHQPDAEGIGKITNIRQAAKTLIMAILDNCPAGPDRSAAVRKAREAMMTANASIVVPFVAI